MGRRYRLYQVDAFTRRPFTGNPAGVVVDAQFPDPPGTTHPATSCATIRLTRHFIPAPDGINDYESPATPRRTAWSPRLLSFRTLAPYLQVRFGDG